MRVRKQTGYGPPEFHCTASEPRGLSNQSGACAASALRKYSRALRKSSDVKRWSDRSGTSSKNDMPGLVEYYFSVRPAVNVDPDHKCQAWLLVSCWANCRDDVTNAISY